MYYAIDVLMGNEIWIDAEPEIDIDKTLGNMFKLFKEITAKKQLWKKGIAITDYKYDIVTNYNYSHSTVLVNVEIVNKNLFKKYMYRNKAKIEKKLSENKSYDGYIALTPKNFYGAIKEMEITKYPDIISLCTVMNIQIPRDEYIKKVLYYSDDNNDMDDD